MQRSEEGVTCAMDHIMPRARQRTHPPWCAKGGLFAKPAFEQVFGSKSAKSRLALRELEAAAGLRLAVLLALDHARVAGEETAALERAAQIGLVGHQRLRQAVT